MSVYGAVYSDIWTDKGFRQLDPQGQKLFLYLLSSPHKTMIGYYKLHRHYAIYDLDFDNETFESSMAQLTDREMAFYDMEEEVVFIKNFLRYNPVKSGQQVKGLFNQLAKAPESQYYDHLIKNLPHALATDVKKEVKDLFWSRYRPFERALKDREGQKNEDENIPYAYPIDRVSDGYGKGIDTPCITVSVSETDKESVSVSGPSLSLDEEKEGKAPSASQDRKDFLTCLEGQKQNPTQTLTLPEQTRKDFRIKLMQSLFKRNLYNSDVGEAAGCLLSLVGDVKETMSIVDGCSVGARSPDNLAERLNESVQKLSKEANTC